MATIQAQWPIASSLSRPEDLPWLTERSPHSVSFLRHMMVAVDVDERRVPARTMDGLVRSCGECRDKTLCAHELGSGRATRSFVDFCPNAEVLLRFR